jgi:Protein of unknown function (DUF2934)
MDAIEQAVRERAYELWDHAGRPNGRSDEFWFAAKAQVGDKAQTESKELRALFAHAESRLAMNRRLTGD